MAMLNQYFKLKDQYREKYGEKTLLLFEVGAFFEVYTKVDKEIKQVVEPQVIEFKRFADLQAARKTETVLMLGFRDYMLDKYIEKIQGNGYTAVVYSQDAKVPGTSRSLQGIYSPGTFFSVNNERISNNICCIWLYKTTKTKIRSTGNIIIGIASIDVLTGKSNMHEIVTEDFHNPTTYDELERFISTYNPNETIIISNMEENITNDIINYIKIESMKIHKLYETDKRVKNAMKQTYKNELIEKFFSYNISQSLIKCIYEFPIGMQSYVYLLNFVYEHNPNLVTKLQEPVIENKSERMLLANHSLQQLNIIDDHNYKGKLSSVSNFLNNCITPMGIRSFKYNILNPTVNREKMERKYNITEYLLNTDFWNVWRKELKNIKDIEKLNRQIYLKKITPHNLFYFNENLSTIDNLFTNINTDETIKTYLQSNITMNINTICNTFKEKFDKIFIMKECSEINTLNFDTNFINRGVNEELDSLIDLLENSEKKLEVIQSYLDDLIAKGEKKNKNNFIKLHQTDKSGISLQCTSRRGKLLKEQIKNTKKIETLHYTNNHTHKDCFEFPLNIEYQPTTSKSNINIVNSVILDICRNITSSKQKISDLVTIIYNDFIKSLQDYEKEFLNLIHFCSSIDILQNMCYIAQKYNYNKPQVRDGEKSYVNANDIRHPLIEQLNTEELYVTNDISIGLEKDLMLLYGTNAVGKTSIIRALGINLIMAQAGLYVACRNFEFVPYTGIFTRILGNDNLFKGLSTFAVEMSELRVILKRADEKSLILGDELCSGTEHDSAVSIFTSGLDMLHNKKTSAIFATHLHEIVDFEEIKQMNNLSIKHMTVSYDKEQDMLIYDRKLKDGPGESMYGLEVCKSLHLPDDFLEKAYEIRNKYKKDGLGEGILSRKTSHFNAKQIVEICEICNKNKGTEVHHLQHQENADKNNMIDHFHKNNKANLVTICDECHHQIHKEGKQHKKVKTSKGTMLMEI
jgi:DNA mismatch repair protein MutS